MTVLTEKNTQGNVATKSWSSVIKSVLLNEVFLAFLIVNITVIAFLSTPLFKSNSYYLPLDELQGTDNAFYDSPTYTDKNNIGFLDPLKVFHPELHYSIKRLSKGEFPLWNPYDGNGIPHLASLQAAVLSPFSIPVYLFGLKDGWLVSQYLKLLAIGMFGYGFLRTLKINSWIALIASIAQTYSGYVILWLLGPHISALITLPAGLFFAERALQSLNSRSRILNLAGFSLSITAGILGGHIESFFFSCVVVASYLLFRIWSGSLSLTAKLLDCVQYALFGLLGFGLAAIQLLPFIEYLGVWSTKGRDVHYHLTFDWLLLNVFPTIYGYPSQSYVIGSGELVNEIFLPYVGAFFVFAALFGLYLLRKNKLFWFFILITLIFTGYIYDFFPFDLWIGGLPGFHQAVAQRGSYCISFGLCVVTAMVLNEFYQRKWNWRLLTAFGISALVFIVSTYGAVFNNLKTLKIDTTTTGFQKYVPNQLLYFIVLFGVAVVGTLLLNVKWFRVLGIILLLVSSFAQSGWTFKDMNGTTQTKFAFPVTSSLKALQTLTGNDNVAFYNRIYLSPMVNLMYDIHDLRYFDALNIPNYAKTLANVLGAGEIIHHTITTISPNALKLFGANYVVSSGLPDATTGKEQLPQVKNAPTAVLEKPYKQTFISQDGNLTTLNILTGTFVQPALNSCHVNFRLIDQAQPDKVLRSGVWECSSAPNGGFWSINFEPIAESKGKTFQFIIDSPDSSAHNKIALYLTKTALDGSSLEINNAPYAGSIIFQELFRPDDSAYKLLWQNDHLQIYKLQTAVPRFYSVGHTLQTATELELQTVIAKHKNDPAKTAILPPEARPSPVGGNEYVPAEVLQDKPEYKKLTFKRTTPGWLTTSLSLYPGWKIKINGVTVPVIRTNEAFIGAPLPAGTSQVEIYYDPLSFKLGWLFSLFSLVGLVGLIGWFWQPRQLKLPVFKKVTTPHV